MSMLSKNLPGWNTENRKFKSNFWLFICFSVEKSFTSVSHKRETWEMSQSVLPTMSVYLCHWRIDTSQTYTVLQSCKKCTEVNNFPGSWFEEEKCPQFSYFFSPNFLHFYRNFLIFTSIYFFLYFPHFLGVFSSFFLYFPHFFLLFSFFSSFFRRIIFSSQFSSISSTIFPHFQFFSPDQDPRIQHFFATLRYWTTSVRDKNKCKYKAFLKKKNQPRRTWNINMCLVHSVWNLYTNSWLTH